MNFILYYFSVYMHVLIPVSILYKINTENKLLSSFAVLTNKKKVKK